MIDLFTIKLNNKYDYIQDVLPASNGTWLCSNSDDTYTKGYSDEVFEGLAKRIEQVEDYKIQNNLYSTIQLVCEYLNNFFYVQELEPRNKHYYIHAVKEFYKCIYDYNTYIFEDNKISPVKKRFNVGDLIHIRGSRNECVTYVTGFSGETIETDNKSIVNTKEEE